MKTLWLLRHAKSSWDDPGVADHDRPLAPRGRKAAKRMRRWASEHRVQPELVLCSSAVRARATLDLVLPALRSPQVEVEAVSTTRRRTPCSSASGSFAQASTACSSSATTRASTASPASSRRRGPTRSRRPRSRSCASRSTSGRSAPGVRPPAAARAPALARLVARLRGVPQRRPEMLVAGHLTPS